MDDYSTILSSIGVVLPEAVRAYIGKVALDLAVLSGSPAPVLFVSKEEADAAILALAEKLREKTEEAKQWKWVAEHRGVSQLRDDCMVELLLARYAEEASDGID